MQISSLSALGGISPLASLLPAPGASAPQAAGASDFSSALKDAVGALGELGAKADASSLALAKGQPVDISEVMINSEQASLGFSMALQVRNKLVDAYQEIMRMSV